MTDSNNNTSFDNVSPLSKARKRSESWTQKPIITISVAVLGLLAILIMLNINVLKHETHLATGETVLLKLAPVDPRGFMQGDYMALSYALERDIFDALQPKPANVELEPGSLEPDDLEPESLETEFNDFEADSRIYQASEGYVILRIDQHNVGKFVRLADSGKRDALAKNEMPIHYRIRNGSVQLATNAFFFQEGHAEAFEAAEYGLFRVNDKGEPLLTEMVNGQFEVIVGTSNQKDETSN